MNLLCKICGSSGFTEYFKGDDRILACENCGIVFLNPALAAEKSGEYYSDRFAGEKYFNPERIKIMDGNSRQILSVLEKKAGNLKNKTLLDIGANAGSFVKIARGEGIQSHGLEPSESMVNFAEKSGVKLKRGYFQNYPENEKFDVITIFHVLEHMADPVQTVRKINLLLSDGGYCVIEVPDLNSYLAKKDGINWKFIAREHLFYFSGRTLSDLLAKNGFEILLAISRNFEIEWLSVKKIMRYLFWKRNIRDRFFIKDDRGKNFGIKEENLLKKCLKKILTAAIEILKRQDHILIIARKI